MDFQKPKTKVWLKSWMMVKNFDLYTTDKELDKLKKTNFVGFQTYIHFFEYISILMHFFVKFYNDFSEQEITKFAESAFQILKITNNDLVSFTFSVKESNKLFFVAKILNHPLNKQNKFGFELIQINDQIEDLVQRFYFYFLKLFLII